MTAYETVIVGTDGSTSSYAAVDRAAAVAVSNDARLIVLCAYRPIGRDDRAAAQEALGDEAYQVEGSAPAEQTLRIALGRAEAVGARRVETLAVEGDPVPALARAVVEAGSASLVVVGNRGLNTLAGRLLGSVPSDIARKAAADVLIVHTT
ncbi:universal stress protein [Streptomyces sp. NBC_00859]|uniref:universal stress protein n=1 Tax=Streptomyces sp. NBC_00859 TaxID=2903682 RepID=UPI00386611D4|nr:universal stress protein [Streptomyces sp. NBC_00859]